MYYYRYLSCYKTPSIGEPPIPSLEGQDLLLQNPYNERTDKIRDCAKVAMSRGFKFFAMFDGGKCLSSPDKFPAYSKYEEHKEMRTHCYRYGYYTRCFSYQIYCLQGYGSSSMMNVYHIYYGKDSYEVGIYIEDYN